VTEIIETYAEDVKVYVCNNPLSFHKRAFPAAAAAYAAGLQGKFWEYDHILWENNTAIEDADLEKYATQAGLDVEKWKKDKESAEIKEWLTSSQALAAALGATGTPAFFVNGEFLSGAKPIEEFREIIDKQIDKANNLLGKKVPAEVLHAVLSGNAVSGKYRRFVIEGKKAPAPKSAEAEEATEPFARAAVELPISDSPRHGEGDEVIITECSDFQ